jgi:hypothetical protein
MQQRTSCDTKTSHEVVGKGKCCSLPLERSPVRSNHSVDWNSHDEGDVEPVDMFIPVGFRDGDFGDMGFLGIVFLVTIWLDSASHTGWWLRSILWW